jgi:hypothetical protein
MSTNPDRNGLTRLFARIPWWIWAAVLLALAARLIPGPRTIDDAFITFRYARHILAGEGFSFNPGEHVLGTTTPLYTLVMVLLGAFTGGAAAPFPALAMAVNALADAVTCVLLWKIGKALGFSLAGAAAAFVWAVAPFSVTFAIGGMETSVFILLSTASVLAYLNKKYPLTFFIAGLAFLTRPDALILIGLLGLGRISHLCFAVEDRKSVGFFARWRVGRGRLVWVATTDRSLRPLLLDGLAFLAPVLPWLVFATVYFGSTIPHSIAAKSLAYHLGPEEGFVRLIQHYTTPFYDQAAIGTIAAIGIGLVVYPFLSIVGFRNTFRRDQRVWAILAYPWVYFIVYAAANPLLFRWYLTPPLPVYYLGILVGAEAVLTGIGGWLQRRSTFQNRPDFQKLACRAPSLLMTIPILFSLAGWTLSPDHGLNRPAPKMAFYQLELLYARTADLISPMLKPGDLLAAGDVGVLGYRTEAKILDTVGLNSPISTGYYPLPASDYAINYAIPVKLILDTQPRFVVFPEVYGRNTLLQSDQFLKEYRLWNTLDTDIYGSHGLLIYIRAAS